MSLLYLVRHGQASFARANYDQLSPLGEAQARAFGEHWAAIGLHFERVYFGPRQRHRQTQDCVAAVYRAKGLPWPEPELLPELDEHQGFAVMRHVLPHLVEQDPAIRELVALAETVDTTNPQPRLKIMQKVLLMWARQELDAADFEVWADFRARVRRGLAQIRAANGSGTRVAAFTSTGPVAVGAGEALNLADEPTLELSWTIRNGTYSEFLFSGERFSLSTFNAASHFHQPELLTYV
jgi:broad specificity phosphatase PhoE